MIPEFNLTCAFSKVPRAPIRLAGDVQLKKNLTLRNVCYYRHAGANLISISAIVSSGRYQVHFGSKTADVVDLSDKAVGASGMGNVVFQFNRDANTGLWLYQRKRRIMSGRAIDFGERAKEIPTPARRTIPRKPVTKPTSATKAPTAKRTTVPVSQSSTVPKRKLGPSTRPASKRCTLICGERYLVWSCTYRYTFFHTNIVAVVMLTD